MKRSMRAAAQAVMNCAHDDKVVTINVGLVREVCQTCAHVSFHYPNDTTGDEVVPVDELAR